MPYATDGLRVGLLGGSFDPPHHGHVHITLWALRNFQLDQVWWMVSPGNPLKKEKPADIKRRMAKCRDLMRHPRVKITDIELHLRTQYTAATLQQLFARYPSTRFMWLMGADNLRNFHKWEDWDWIMQNVPIGVLARPGEQVKAGLSLAARKYAPYRLPAKRAEALPFRATPAWTLLNGRMVRMSSTELRDRGEWVR